MTDGIDVSYAQGARYNWHQWDGKISFGMAKATEGLSITDPDLGENWDAMWAMNNHRLPRFAYHYFHPAEDAAAQARHFVSTVREHGLLPGDNLVMDLESSGGQHPSIVASRAARFLGMVNGLAPNHRVLVYTNPSFAGDGNCLGLRAWHLWIANYGVLQPQVPREWPSWTFWQAGESPVDTDRFNGTTAELLEFARMPKARLIRWGEFSQRCSAGRTGSWSATSSPRRCARPRRSRTRFGGTATMTGGWIGLNANSTARAAAMREDRGEDSLAANVQRLMGELDLWGYHSSRPLQDPSGWPDWAIIGPGGMLFRELKSQHGTLSPAQRGVGARLILAGQNWAVWRPCDLLSGVIERQLRDIA